MDQVPEEQIVAQLIAQLIGKLREYEDAETAIDVYKTANWIIAQLEDVKKSCLALARQDLALKKLKSLKTSIGSAGWTRPKAKQLDERAWQTALAQDARLMRLQREFDMAQAALRQAQEPFMQTPESGFFIR